MDDMGFLYDLHEKMREIVTSFNDTTNGRCAVCLENFNGEEDQEESESNGFASRVDLVRIDRCFHRFHLLCLHRDWFMERKSEKDQYGCVINFKLPETKRCPICRRDVEEQEIKYIQDQMADHPEIEDRGYDSN
jgi:hypothetical protein